MNEPWLPLVEQRCGELLALPVESPAESRLRRPAAASRAFAGLYTPCRENSGFLKRDRCFWLPDSALTMLCLPTIFFKVQCHCRRMTRCCRPLRYRGSTLLAGRGHLSGSHNFHFLSTGSFLFIAAVVAGVVALSDFVSPIIVNGRRRAWRWSVACRRIFTPVAYLFLPLVEASYCSYPYW